MKSLTEKDCPFPYFGGKRRVAAQVWQALAADVPGYTEPFAGSLAVLRLRPGGAGKIETVNDLDGLLVNVWRALAYQPEATAEAADWPVSELDIRARHGACRAALDGLPSRLEADPRWCDPELAGWWIYGACATIGDTWHKPRTGRGIPHLGGYGGGIHQLHGRLRREALRDWFGALSTRLDRVRICCGDWRRMLSYSAMGADKAPIKGVFLDPPYDPAEHGVSYAHGAGAGVSADVRAWCLEHGADPALRIVLAGYAGEGHEALEAEGWRVVAWKASGGFGNTSKLRDEGSTRGASNAGRERLWLSPHCLAVDNVAVPGP